MCGIVGVVSCEPTDDARYLTAMRDTLSHRGPDDSGAWSSRDKRVHLGHRRLSIIDLSPGGHQPMHSPDGNVTLVFNGEIYNFAELREELQAGGVSFRSTSDTEVLLEAYLRWGTSFLERLDGMFAFALYDARERKLLLARDRAGEKPLFYYHHNGRLMFASETKALLAHPDTPRRLNAEALNEYLAYGYVSADRCLLDGLKKLPPAHAMEFNLAKDQLRAWVYWRLPAEAPQTGDAVELQERFTDLLRNSVRRRLVADVPVGIMLSGGIDSSLVTAMAAEVSSRPVKTFTVVFPGEEKYNEGPYAKQVSDHLGTDHVELICQPAEVSLLEPLARQYDEPIGDSSMVPTYLVSRQIRRHATVALGGDGGDELFGGYELYRWDLKFARWRKFLPDPLRKLLRACVRRWLPRGKCGRGVLMGLFANPEQCFAELPFIFDEDLRRELLASAAQPAGDLAEPAFVREALLKSWRDPMERICRSDFLTYMPNDILVKVDRASMLTSLEVRAPFLDHAIIEFAFGAVPVSLRGNEAEGKILPRRLAKQILPKELDLTRKQGFALPLQSWFRGEWGAYCHDVLTDSKDLFRPAAIERLFDEQRRNYFHTHRIFALTVLELWRRAYGIAPPV